MAGRPVLVQKFGGTSVSTPERRQLVVGHVARARDGGNQVAIVVSAMGRRGDPYATDTLLDLLRADGRPVDPADYDLMFTCGETIAVAVVSQALKRAGIPAAGLTGAQARIFTDGHHVEADIVEVDTGRLRSLLDAGVVPVVAGGQGVARDTLDFTTLGRGGSDTSGVALGVALRARRVDIFTDVEGVAVADPKIVPGARMLQRVSYESMYELARFGAKVVHPRALKAGWAGRTPIAVRSTFSGAPGTLVAGDEDEAPLVGLAHLPGLHTVALEAGAAPGLLEEWERRRLIVSLTDGATGRLLLGAATDKLPDLHRAIDEAGTPVLSPERPCWWLTIVGNAAAVRDRAEGFAAAFRRESIEVCGHEVAGGRVTFVVPDAAGERAARLAYRQAFEASMS
jgi:aspartokinase